MAETTLLKKDLFGEVRCNSGENGATIVRDASCARFWARPLGRWLLRREAQVLAALRGVAGTPRLLALSNSHLVREHLPGQPMHIARPRDPAYFAGALTLLRRLHGAGVTHNDLAKEANILVTEDGQPAFIDYQLAWAARRRGKLFRVLAYEDLRHLLKHKRTYCPDALTSRQRAILARPGLPSRIWMKTGKPVYLFITRRLFGWADREGATDRGQVN